jgi:hypothetical protein
MMEQSLVVPQVMTYDGVNILFEYFANLVLFTIDLVIDWFDAVGCLTSAVLNEFFDVANEFIDFVAHSSILIIMDTIVILNRSILYIYNLDLIDDFMLYILIPMGYANIWII